MAVTAQGRSKAKKRSRTRAASKSRTRKAATTPAKPSLSLDLRQRLGLNQTTFARLLPVSVRTLATLESGSPPTEVPARRLSELQRLTNALTEVLEEEALGKWLQTPNPAFEGLKPIEVIERGESDRLWSMIYFLRSGVPS